MMSLMPVLKQDDYLHKYKIFFIKLRSFFSVSYVRFMSCHVTETMLYCIQTINYTGSGETAHMCKLV